MDYYRDFSGPALYDRFFNNGRQSAQLLIKSVASYLKPGMKVLDVGCGTGHVTCEVASLVENGQVLGIDMDEKALVLAYHKAQKSDLSITFQKGDALHLDFKDQSFEMALANQLPVDQEKSLAEMVRVLLPGSIVGVARPHSPSSQVFKFGHDVACEIAFQQGKEPPELSVLRRSDPVVVRDIFKKVGLEIIELEEKKYAEHSLEQLLLGNIAQGGLRGIISPALQIDSEDEPAMIKGCMDYLEVAEKVWSEKYDGKLEHACTIAIGRKVS
ncbi:MAG: methyltransferase domain-containing protein [Candidatus Latescibacteria bacterium]|nr:methyltransferase domain-containing protein [Candidatus Latescibacterota bacterium]